MEQGATIEAIVLVVGMGAIFAAILALAFRGATQFAGLPVPEFGPLVKASIYGVINSAAYAFLIGLIVSLVSREKLDSLFGPLFLVSILAGVTVSVQKYLYPDLDGGMKWKGALLLGVISAVLAFVILNLLGPLVGVMGHG